MHDQPSQPAPFGSDYAVPRDADGRKFKFKVRGLRIGRFFVHSRFEGMQSIDHRHQQIYKAQDWIMLHINSGLVLSFPTLERALCVADDLSRYAKRDPSTRSTNPEVLIAQLGKDLVRWAELMTYPQTVFVAYRVYRAVQRPMSDEAGAINCGN